MIINRGFFMFYLQNVVVFQSFRFAHIFKSVCIIQALFAAKNDLNLLES